MRVVEVFGDADDCGAVSLVFFGADDDVGVLAACGVGEGEDVFDEFAFLVVSGDGQGVLRLFEVERGALVFPEERFDGVVE